MYKNISLFNSIRSVSMFDTHTHLNDDKLFPDRQTHVQDFVAVWGQWIVNVAVNHEWAARAIHIARTGMDLFPDTTILATVWIHPSEACFEEITKDNVYSMTQKIKEIYHANSPFICAIWECGIDTHYPDTQHTLEVQKLLFAEQCKIATELDLPLIIHSRDWFHETMDVLLAHKNITCVFHCFWYWSQEAKEILRQFPNAYFGFDGNITYPKATDLREAFLDIPLEKILLETDAPYLAPQWLRWSINTPANVQTVYSFTATLRWDEYESYAHQINKNARRFYGIPDEMIS
jgi:TatD DNase family protein